MNTRENSRGKACKIARLMNQWLFGSNYTIQYSISTGGVFFREYMANLQKCTRV